MHNLLNLRNNKNRLLGIDYGERTIGLAVSDLSWRVARPLPPLDQKQVRDILSYLKELIDQEHIVAAILGYPRNMNGTEGPSCEKVRIFAEFIKPLGIEIVFWDERMTTVLAENIMLEGDLTRKKRKKRIDSLAASYILQNYLDQY